MGKEVGNNKIHRTRILSIYEADYSVFISLMWKDLLSSSEKRGTLNRDLHRGRCGHDAQTVSLIEDFKILPNIFSLVARKKGFHKNVIFVHAQMLEQAKYRLKTALGVSEEYYQHINTFPIYGSW
eukprot:4898655-Ditylum_brightwellii.AAC.2